MKVEEAEVEEAEVEEAEVEEAEVEEVVEVELAEEELPNHPIKGTLANKEPYQRNSKEIAPKQKNLSKTCEATFA